MRRISIKQALDILDEHVGTFGIESIPLDQCQGRVLREPILADRDIPAFDRVMMDGIAIKMDAKVREWRITGKQYAGEKPLEINTRSDCVQIMTGAVLPTGTDTVIPLEDYSVNENSIQLNPSAIVETGQYIHKQGSDAPKAATLYGECSYIDSRILAICATVGMTQLKVSALPRVSFISTGDELIEIHKTPEQPQIRRSNDQLISANLKSYGIDLAANIHCQDDPVAISDILNQLSENSDLIVMSGGVSKGDADYIVDCSREIGFQERFHWVRQKPGGPLYFATREDGTMLLGLPGNPLSSLVCTRIYLGRILKNLLGLKSKPTKLTLADNVNAIPRKGRILPAQIVGDAQAKIVYPNTSGDLVSILQADGLVILPETNNEVYPQGYSVDYLPGF